MSAPTVFISYSHDSEDHKAWVRKLGESLRANSVDASLDQWDTSPGQDLGRFMHAGIAKADRVLVICSDQYVRKAEDGAGGVGYEGLIITAEVVQAIDTKKFIPIIRRNAGAKKTPGFLGIRKYISFEDDAAYETSLDELLRELLGTPVHAKPPLGPNPFSGTPKTDSSIGRVTGASGLAPTGGRILGEQWFEERRAVGIAGLEKLKLKGSMELRFGLHDTASKSQIELLDAARESQIKTFGWPIGLVIEKEEYRPKPFADGIRAEIAVEKDSFMGRPSYDYWAARENGDYYTIQSLFEDYRDTGKQVFFNTRIVRVAEGLMFAQAFYTSLGVAPETNLSIRVQHEGLKGRTLAAVGNRLLSGSPTSNEEMAQAEIIRAVGAIGEHIVQDVKKITSPLFLLFDFQQFADAIYEDIVTRFQKGEAS